MAPQPTPLLDLLKPVPKGSDKYIGVASHEPHVRAFGGHVLGQAVAAASASAPIDRPMHSLHAYFLRPGAPSKDIHYQVDAVRDGRSFSVRHLSAIQDGKSLFEMTSSFHQRETSVEHVVPMPEVTAPDNLQPFEKRFSGREQADMERWFVRAKSFDIRYLDHTPFDQPRADISPQQRLWIRCIEPLEDSPALHRAVLAYASDMTVLDPILMKHQMRWTDQAILGATLDHSMWFHRDFRADEWLLLDQESSVSYGARGFVRAQVWTQQGQLVCSFTQEALQRSPLG